MTPTKFPPTAEQQTALALFQTGKSLAIEAGAGAGKTSTLMLLAASTRKRGQYIAFNKAIVTEAGAKMPPNVACNTAHSLAYKAIIPGTRFQDRLRNSRRMRSLDIAARLRINEPIRRTLQDGTTKSLGRAYLAGLAMRAVTKFCQSADLEPDARHVPYVDGIDVPPGRTDNNRLVARALEQAVKRAWDDIKSDTGTLPFKHDHYLKMWHLSRPRINADFILFDEAQDANPVLVAIVKAQAHAQLIWVGDSQQQIYSFTGALNALQTVGADQEAYLTQSFRFGPAIADKANEVLELLKAPLKLTGTPDIASRITEIADPDVYLTRTNAAAVRRVLDEITEGRKPHLVVGGQDVIAFARAAQKLMAGETTEHPELACFETWQEVRDYVDQDEQGSDLRLLVSLIDEFGVVKILQALEEMPDERDADLVVSTAHKAKGREWAKVQIADDFPQEPKGEELRLLYVAVTRAKLELDLTRCAALHTANGNGQPDSRPVAPPAGTGQDSAPKTPADRDDWDAAAEALDRLGFVEQARHLRRAATVRRARA